MHPSKGGCSLENLPHDGHTHTTFSDGRNSVEENVRAAEAAGIECVAITDHFNGDEHRATLPRRIEAVRMADAESPIKVIMGLEAVILDTEGTVSVSQEEAAQVDWVLADFGWQTRGVALDPPADPDRLHENVLAAVRNAAANPVVDAIAHPFSLGRFDAVLRPRDLSRDGLKRVARGMVESNVAFELMNQAYWWYPGMTVAQFTRDFATILKLFSAAGVKFVAGSDAHSCGAVGNLHYTRHLMHAAGIELSQLVDLKRMVEVRGKG